MFRLVPLRHFIVGMSHLLGFGRHKAGRWVAAAEMNPLRMCSKLQHTTSVLELHRWQFMLDLDGFLLDYQARAKRFACFGTVCTCLFPHGMMLDKIVECRKDIAILYDTVTCGVTYPHSCWQTIRNVQVAFADKVEWLFRRLFLSMVEWRHLVGNWRRASGGDWNRSQQKTLNDAELENARHMYFVVMNPLWSTHWSGLSLSKMYANGKRTLSIPSCVGRSVVKCIFFLDGYPARPVTRFFLGCAFALRTFHAC